MKFENTTQAQNKNSTFLENDYLAKEDRAYHYF
jgi:hypothetical protein